MVKKSGHAAPRIALRTATIERNTTETRISLKLTIEGEGQYRVSTGIRFFDHMLELFTRHGAFNLDLTAPQCFISLPSLRFGQPVHRKKYLSVGDLPVHSRFAGFDVLFKRFLRSLVLGACRRAQSP